MSIGPLSTPSGDPAPPPGLEAASPSGPATGHRPPGPGMRGFVAVAAVVVATGGYFASESFLADRPFALFFAAVFVAAWYGGFGPGLLATGLGVLVLQPVGAISFGSAGEALQSLTYFGVSLVASALSGQLHRAHALARASAEENALLAVRLQEQAIELETQTEEAQALTEELEQQVEEAARLRLRVEHANERLSAILDTLAEAVVLAAPDGTVTFANPAGRRLLPRLPADRGPLRFDGHAFDLRQPTPLARVLRGGEGVTLAELSVPATDGPVALRVTAAPLREGGHAPLGVVASFFDVTAEREAEDALRFTAQAAAVLASSLDYEETLRRVCRLAVPSIADFCVVDLLEEGTIRRVEAVHADPEQADTAALALRHPPSLDHPLHPVPVVLRTGETQIHNGIVPEMTDGSEEHTGLVRRLATTAYLVVPMRAGTQVMGALSLLISGSGRGFGAETVRLAEELGVRAGYAIENARLYARTAEANRAKSDFLAVMSHELRTPLNAILGYTDLFLAGIPEPLPAPMVPQVERVQGAARHLRDLIEEVLSFARLESGHEEVQAEPVDVAGVALEAAALAEPLALERGLVFRVEVPDAPVIARADARKVRQVLLNLLANAVKFTDRGEVALSMEDGAGVTVRVRDTGPGIAPENRERIFEPFWQADQGLAREHGGSGLGLSVARQMARLMGGDITVESAPGAGSTFALRLPAE